MQLPHTPSPQKRRHWFRQRATQGEPDRSSRRTLCSNRDKRPFHFAFRFAFGFATHARDAAIFGNENYSCLFERGTNSFARFISKTL
jgi:hypothetical protein